MPPGSFRKVLSRGALILFALAGSVGVLLILLGGFDVKLFGRAVSSHEPMRPILIASLLLGIFMLTGGDDAVVRVVDALDGRLARVTPAFQERWCRIAVAALAVGLTAIGIVWGSKAAGGSDSYGYLSQAELWLSGRVTTPQPWAGDVPWPNPLATFTPLGYVEAPTSGVPIFGHRPSHQAFSIVPTYSPGLPMLMAAAKSVGGNPALFVVVPILGGLTVLATFGIGRRLGSALLGAIAALLVATSPPFVEYALSPLTDAPASAAWALALWGAFGRTMRSAWATGLALAIAILIRPDRVPLAAPIALWLLISVWRHSEDRRLHIGRGIVILGGLAVGMAAVAIIFWHSYGSPFMSGYGAGGSYFAPTYFFSNLAAYASELSQAQSPFIFFGVAALVFPIRRLWPTARDRTMVTVLALFTMLVVAEFSFINRYAAWVRFLLPGFAPIMVAMAAAICAVGRLGRGARVLCAVVVVLSGIAGVNAARARWEFVPPREARFFELMDRVRQALPDNSVVLAMMHSGSARYYTGRETLRYDQLDPEWLDRTLRWLDERGVHSFAVLEDWELPELRRQFAGQAALKRFERAVFNVPGTSFYDLTSPEASAVTEVLPDPLPRRFGIPPAPAPTLVLKR